MKIRYQFWIGFIVLSILIVFLMVLLYWTIRPYQLPSVRIETTETLLSRGDTIPLILFINKPAETNTPRVTVYQRCDDGFIYTLEARELNTPVTDGEVAIPSSRFTVPEETNTGVECHIEFKNEYKVNPIRSIIKIYDSNKYYIKE